MKKWLCWSSWKVKKWKKKYVITCNPLSSRVKIGWKIETPKQLSLGDWLHWVGRNQITSGEDMNMLLHRPIQELICQISCSSVASQHNRKTSKFSTLVGTLVKGGCLFEQWAFKVKGVMQSCMDTVLREGIVCCLWGPGLVFGAACPIGRDNNEIRAHAWHCGVIQHFDTKSFKLQQGKTEKVPVYVPQLQGELNVVQQEYPKFKNTCLFHGLHKQLYTSMHYLYDDPRVMYPQLMTAALRLSMSRRTDLGRESK